MGEMTTKELREKQLTAAAEAWSEQHDDKLTDGSAWDVLAAYRDLAGKIDKAGDPLDVLAVLQEIMEAYRDGRISGWDYGVLTRLALCSPVVQ